MEVQLDMYQTLAASVLVLMLGSYLKQQIHVLEKFCIPAPVVGGLLFAIVTCICYSSGFMEISFDDTLREVCMVFFFTSVGFQANLKVLKSGGKSLAIFLGLVILLIVLQNLLAIGTSHLLGIDALPTEGCHPQESPFSKDRAFQPAVRRAVRPSRCLPPGQTSLPPYKPSLPRKSRSPPARDQTHPPI